MIGGKAPTAAQKRWHEWLADSACMGCGNTHVSLHHAAGSSARHNKVWIGQWWVIPLCYDCHQGSGGVHGDMSSLKYTWLDGMSRKDFEKAAHQRLVHSAGVYGITTPPEEVYDAIMDYRK